VLQDVQSDYYVTQRVLIANNNTHFAGLEVDSVGKAIPDDYDEIYYATAGIFGENLDNVAITGSLLKTSVDFTNPGGGVYHPSAGAYFHLSDHVTIADNEIHVDGENSFGAVFSLETGDEGNVSNQMIGNTIYVSGAPAIAISMAGKDGLVRNNDVHLSGEGERGIILTGVDNSLADHNTIAIDAGASSIGFVFNSADNSTIDHNTVTTQDAAGGAQGVTVQLGSDSTISNNTFTMTGAGIYVSAGTDNLAITGNTLTSKTGDGLRFADGSFLLSDNTFTGQIGGHVVRFTNSSASVLAGSSGNVLAAGTTLGGLICGGPSDFTGTWSIADNRTAPGALNTFTDSCEPVVGP
jgi:parallel beta-helix repeat protein